MLYATSNCYAGFWRTMPELVLNEHTQGIQSEQIDTDQEDHVSDEVMYACMSRPWMRHVEKKEEKRVKDWFREKEEASSWRTV